MWAVWRYGGEDPYKLWNGPDAGPPLWPSRVRTWLYGMGMFSIEHEAELAGAKQRPM